ncbi:nucleoside deaminase [Roseivivax sp. GX 12232]|uniref:nucleoside deaminase n=1 Tax=Roseivivax sp. GX 12232 TaxID=2900547 RepID=UPI001E3C0986|nr:nucleoside deaminase [Roseivivax sp. GX 12232]MCE0505602.1 nucleoside deaminase [Roseivivax sp. GX 12232]
MALTPTESELAALDQVIAEARALYEARGGQGPVFTAAVVKDGQTVTLDRNEVSDSCDPSRHAEIVALGRAAAALGGTDLSGATLVASMQPCEMCLAAMRWAGIDRLVFAMTQEAAPDFFQFPALGLADFARASGGAFDWAGGLRLEELRDIYGAAR